MIGVFDSGSGGLSVLRALRARLPSTDVLYFGDIQNAPYGEKTPKELSLLTMRAMSFLELHGATSVVSACNSVSASLAVSLFDVLNLTSDKLIEMAGPTVSSFRSSSERVLLCATPATVFSGIYQNGFRMTGKEITTIAIPELAGAIEFGVAEDELEHIIRDAFSDIVSNRFDVLVLGCTHYSLIAPVFERIITQMFGNDVRLFDPADAVADRAQKQFLPQEAGDGNLHFVITKESEPFRARVAQMFPDNADLIEVVK